MTKENGKEKKDIREILEDSDERVRELFERLEARKRANEKG